ncbi:SGNH/GDSL hydrolase family protein [Methylocystis sp.]|uniref:SGNH/GDSL hydrolase family protein n=1 Tax=Methylocystis sp. TaxID=1911079 RepID=UPI003DA2E1C8
MILMHKEKIKFFVQQIALILLTLVILDFGLWLFHPFFLNTGGTVLVHQSLSGLKPQIMYSVIEGGMRSLSIKSLSDRKMAKRVLCVGASTTDQSTQETGDTWCGLLEKLIKDNSDEKRINFQTISFGRGGMKSIETAGWLFENVDLINPDIVITLLGVNDLSLNGGPEYQTKNPVDYITRIQEKSANVRDLFEQYCLKLSQLCRVTKLVQDKIRVSNAIKAGDIVEWHSANLPTLRQKYKDYPFVDAPIRTPDPIVEFQDSVRWILNFLSARGVRVIVLGQPVLWKDALTSEENDVLWFPVNTYKGFVRTSAAWHQMEIQKFNEAQKQEASAFGFEFIDLDRILPKTLSTYFDDCHYTDQGSAAVAQAVAPSLRRMLTNMSP